ncbi:hypothetical protein Pyn_16244 [Prunus yedoensis var. nudiflora]|uniref:Pre-mRNA-splicing factor SLU7 n=1 Tax=Prunus yedoensis var. nudiflora TaxID=2094558 RepID=A0A315A079_PRUYE|nr:hypothetical protein Pyn_16244 [Prunus yedoensis var. nudiflora]
MREDPLPDADPNEKFYGGDNQYRVSGQALEFKTLNIHAWEAFEKGQDIHMQAAPSQAELLYKNYKVIKDKLKSRMKDAIMEKYGNAATEEVLPKELLLGQSEKQVEYDRAGRVVKGMETSLPKSNYCTGAAGIEAAEEAADLMKANIARKAASEETPAPTEEKRLATWELICLMIWYLTRKNLMMPLRRRIREERKRRMKESVNIMLNGMMRIKDLIILQLVTPEEMEAYRMKMIHNDDPMKDFLH